MGSNYDPGAEPTYRLTRRQVEILEFVACGLSGKMIATQTGIKYQTVKNHLLSIRRSLGALSTSHAVRIAIERKLIEICSD